jgi:hypothetical protein
MQKMTSSTDTTKGAFAERLLTSCRGLFSTILLADAGSDGTWSARLETLRKHGLLTVRMPSPFKPTPVEIDQSKMDDSRYRKRIAKKLAAPRPSRWTFINLRVDRERFQSDETYRSELCHYFAARWVENLLDSDAVEQLVLVNLNANQLGKVLTQLGPHQISPAALQQYIIRNLAEELVDSNPRFLAIEAELKAACAKVRDETMAAVRKITDDIRAQHLREMDAAAVELNARCDEAIARIRERVQASAARSAEALAEAESKEDVDPEVEWQQSVAARERALREANRWSPAARLLVTVASVAAAAALIMFAEVDGTSLAELFFGGEGNGDLDNH